MAEFNKIEIGSISIKAERYQLTSAYICLFKQNENEIVGFSQENLALINYELIDEFNISLFIDSKKLEEMEKKDFKNNEFIFPEPYIIKVHIHDMVLFEETYYLMILIADKIVKSPNTSKYCLNIKVKDGDEKFIFSHSKGFCSYMLSPVKEE